MALTPLLNSESGNRKLFSIVGFFAKFKKKNALSRDKNLIIYFSYKKRENSI